MKQKKFQLILPLLFVVLSATSQSNVRSVFHANEGNRSHWLTYQDNHKALYRIITNEAFELLDNRKEQVAQLYSEAEWKKYQSNIKSTLCSSLQKFTKTPLNARTTGILERETFTVEKIIFESHPGFYVTAGLFLPKKRQKPAPAVIYSCGHTELGFRSEVYQRVIMNLVQKGFIVLAFDPIGQGERLQYPDPESGISKIGSPTKEHSYAGIQTLLTGTALTDYFIWDGVRLLDFLETRPEVDMKRIGITGRSGGGTQTAQIAACDDRILAAAPENYITSFKRLLQAIGPQDAEQNPYKAIANGFDHADYIHIRAPKPTLMITTTHDYFSIQGARETFSEARKSYSALGKPDNLQMVEDFGVHQSTKNNRETLYAFFQKHLNLPGDSNDQDIEPFSLEELQVTPTGQIGTSYKGETVFSLNKKYYPDNKPNVSNLAKELAANAGINPVRKLTASVYTGKFFEEDIEVEKYFIENDLKDYALPFYILKKTNNKHGNLVVWLHSEGKAKLLEEPLLNEILDAGYTVLSADLPGIGELNDPEFTGDGVIRSIPFNYTFGANLIGKSIAGIQAEAIDLIMQHVENDNRFNESKTTALVQGTAAFPFLHFAVIDNKFRKAAFYDFPDPVKDLMEEEFYDPADAYPAVPGSLLLYDFPELIKHLSDSGTKVITQKTESMAKRKTNNLNSQIIEFIKN